MSPKRRSKKSSEKNQSLPSSHEQRVFQLGGKLLDTLEKNKLPREDENIKSLGWLLVCIGESLQKGSLQEARARRVHIRNGQVLSTPSLAVALCINGDQIMDWAVQLYLRQQTHETKKAKPPKPILIK